MGYDQGHWFERFSERIILKLFRGPQDDDLDNIGIGVSKLKELAQNMGEVSLHVFSVLRSAVCLESSGPDCKSHIQHGMTAAI